MPLSDQQVRTVVAEFTQEEFIKNSINSALSTQDLRTAAIYTYGWIESNIASYISGLPEPFKTVSTATQKQKLFLWVLRKLLS